MTRGYAKKSETNIRRFRQTVKLDVPKIVRTHLQDLADDAGVSMREYLEKLVWNRWMDVIWPKRRAAKAAEREK
jgi:hypothetical protein